MLLFCVYKLSVCYCSVYTSCQCVTGLCIHAVSVLLFCLYKLSVCYCSVCTSCQCINLMCIQAVCVLLFCAYKLSVYYFVCLQTASQNVKLGDKLSVTVKLCFNARIDYIFSSHLHSIYISCIISVAFNHVLYVVFLVDFFASAIFKIKFELILS